MQCLEVSGAVRLIYRSLGVKGLSSPQQNKTSHQKIFKLERHIINQVTVQVGVINPQ